MARTLILLIVFFVAASCRTTEKYADRGSERFEIRYRYEDNPQQKRIIIYFQNTSNKAICLGPENWPEKGILLGPGREASIEVNGQHYFLGPENDFCPRCNKKVAPGESVQDFFEYKSFGLKEEFELSEKKLHFSPVGYSCK